MGKQSKIVGLVAAGAAVTGQAALGQDSLVQDGLAGPYVGLSFGTFGGEIGEDYLYGTPSGELAGFAGYNFVSGDIVYGAEITYWADALYDSYGGPYGYSGLLDVKARVGKTFGNAFVYGTAGVFQTDYAFYDLAEYYGGKAKGWSIGFGVEAQVTDNMFMGVDITRRDATSDSGQDGDKFGGPLTTVAVRAGFRF